MLAVLVSASASWGGSVVSDVMRYFGAATCLFVMATSGLPGGTLAPIGYAAVVACALTPLIGGIGGYQHANNES